MDFGGKLGIITSFSPTGNVLVPNSERVRVDNGLIEISNVQLSDAGVYSCEASNEIGSIERTVQLSLSGKVAGILHIEKQNFPISRIALYGDYILSLKTMSILVPIDRSFSFRRPWHL